MPVGRVVAVVAVLLWPVTGQAKEPLKLEYHDRAGCETADGFTSAVHALTRLVRAAAPGELARTFRITLERSASGQVEGQVSGAAPGGAMLRLGASGTCEDVLRMLSFGIAFTLDPTAEAAAPETLPENPYWTLLATLPPDPPFPDNPYRARTAADPALTTDSGFPNNPYRSGAASAISDAVTTEPASVALPSNPYR